MDRKVWPPECTVHILALQLFKFPQSCLGFLHRQMISCRNVRRYGQMKLKDVGDKGLPGGREGSQVR